MTHSMRDRRILIIGGGRHEKLLAQALIAAGAEASLDTARGQVNAALSKKIDLPEPTQPHGWDTGNRKRAQWKDETNRRGRSR